MGQLLIVLAVALVAAALVFGITVLIMGGDQGLEPAEPDGRSVPLPGSRPLTESDLSKVRFDVTVRGYRMTQVDQALRRAGYDLGYKEELIGVLEAEVDALRAGRVEEADALRAARESAARPNRPADDEIAPAGAEPTDESDAADPGAPEPEGRTIDLDTPPAADVGGTPDPEGAVDGDGDQQARDLPVGPGRTDDPAAVEPAK